MIIRITELGVASAKVLAEYYEEKGFVLPMTIVVIDQRNEAARVTLEVAVQAAAKRCVKSNTGRSTMDDDSETAKLVANSTKLAGDICDCLADYSTVVGDRVIADPQVSIAALGRVTAMLIATPLEGWEQRLSDFVAHLKQAVERVAAAQQASLAKH